MFQLIWINHSTFLKSTQAGYAFRDGAATVAGNTNQDILYPHVRSYCPMCSVFLSWSEDRNEHNLFFLFPDSILWVVSVSFEDKGYPLSGDHQGLSQYRDGFIQTNIGIDWMWE